MFDTFHILVALLIITAISVIAQFVRVLFLISADDDTDEKPQVRFSNLAVSRHTLAELMRVRKLRRNQIAYMMMLTSQRLQHINALPTEIKQRVPADFTAGERSQSLAVAALANDDYDTAEKHAEDAAKKLQTVYDRLYPGMK